MTRDELFAVMPTPTQEQLDGRVEIMKDVLKWIDDPVMPRVSTAGSYFSVTKATYREEYVDFGSREEHRNKFWKSVDQKVESSQLADLIPGIGDQCQVCALGAAMISRCRVFDKIPASKYLGIAPGTPSFGSWQYNSYASTSKSRVDVTDDLEDFFDIMTLNFIEAAFERCRGALAMSYVPREIHGDPDKEHAYSRELSRATEYNSGFGLPKDRMRTIARNIIVNGGHFRYWEAPHTEKLPCELTIDELLDLTIP